MSSSFQLSDKNSNWPSKTLSSDKNYNWSLMMSPQFRWTHGYFNSHTASLRILTFTKQKILSRSRRACTQIKHCPRQAEMLMQQEITPLARGVAHAGRTKVIKKFRSKVSVQNTNAQSSCYFENQTGSIRRNDRSESERTIRRT